jgi:hypothetical protein
MAGRSGQVRRPPEMCANDYYVYYLSVDLLAG